MSGLRGVGGCGVVFSGLSVCAICGDVSNVRGQPWNENVI